MQLSVFAPLSLKTERTSPSQALLQACRAVILVITSFFDSVQNLTSLNLPFTSIYTKKHKEKAFSKVSSVHKDLGCFGYTQKAPMLVHKISDRCSGSADIYSGEFNVFCLLRHYRDSGSMFCIYIVLNSAIV